MGQESDTIRQACHVILEVTTDVVMERARRAYTGDLEPWEMYEARKRAKMRENTRILEQRVVSGFQVLLESMEGK